MKKKERKTVDLRSIIGPFLNTERFATRSLTQGYQARVTSHRGVAIDARPARTRLCTGCAHGACKVRVFMNNKTRQKS